MKHAEIVEVYSWICSDNMQDIHINFAIYSENIYREFERCAERV
jgi:hypothetical protein